MGETWDRRQREEDRWRAAIDLEEKARELSDRELGIRMTRLERFMWMLLGVGSALTFGLGGVAAYLSVR